MDDLNFFRGRRIFITGHTGFKGSWLTLWLLRHGAIISGFSLDVPSTPSLFESLGLAAEIQHFTGDMRDAEYLSRVLETEQPEIVFHLAAQALVRRGFQNPKQTFDVNVGGTVNLLEAIRHTECVRAVLCITSDKCYDSREWEWGLRENDPLGAGDPYGASKAAAELVAAAYRKSYFSPSDELASRIGLATARAGNVIGGGDWAEDRLVPDCIRALVADEPIVIRCPESIRPWQHVLEPLAGYLTLAKRLWDEPDTYSGPWNFGPPVDGARSVTEIVQEITRLWGYGQWKRAGNNQSPGYRETDYLRLSSDKAMSLLSWRPQWTLSAALKRTVEWYRAFYWHGAGPELRDLCDRHIRQYESSAGLSASVKSHRNRALAESSLR
jgi:CDP-glucose 4,6-dehydratase